MTAYETISSVTAIATLVLGLTMAYFALRSLRGLVRQVEQGSEANKLQHLLALLALEERLMDHRCRFSAAGVRLAELGANGPADPATFQAAKLQFDETKQVYLNVLDRFCSCILRGWLREEDLRVDYREYVATIIRDLEADFRPGTIYRNIVRLHERWAET